MTLKKPIIAAICAAVLFAIFLWDVNRVERGVMQELQNERVIWQNPETATAIEFIAGGETVRVERDADDAETWWLTKPKRERANTIAITTWLENLRGAKRHSVFEAPNLAEYGLDTPVARVDVTLREDDGSEVTKRLLFGAQPFEFGRVYAKLADEDEVFTISEWFFRQSEKDFDMLRDRTVVRVPVERAERITIDTRVNKFSAVRTRDDGALWSIEHEGELLPADITHIDRVMFNLGAGKFVEIMDRPTSTTAELGLATPAATIYVDDKPVLSIGAPVSNRERFVVQNSANMIGTVPASLLSDFFRPPLEWGTKRFVWHAPEDITQLEITSGGTYMMLLHTMDQWLFPDRPGVPVREDRIEDYFQTITSLAATQLVEARLSRDDRLRYGIVDESFHVSVGDKDGNTQGFTFGRTNTNEGQVFVLRTQDQSLWKMDFRGKIGATQFRRDFEERRIFPNLAAKTHRFNFTTQQGSVTFENTGSAWQANLPNGQRVVVRTDLVQAFLASFEAMEADSEMITQAREPNVTTYEFYSVDKEKIAEAGLIRASESGETVLFNIDGSVVDVPIKQYAVMDQAFANLLGQGPAANQQGTNR